MLVTIYICILGFLFKTVLGRPAQVAQSNAHPPGMRMVAGLILRSSNIVSWRFLWHSLPTSDSSRAVVSYWRKDVHLVLVNRLGSLTRISVVTLTDRLDMTLVVVWDVKPQITVLGRSKFFLGLLNFLLQQCSCKESFLSYLK